MGTAWLVLVDADPGDMVGDSIVEFPRDVPPLILLGLRQAPEQRIVARIGLLAMIYVRDHTLKEPGSVLLDSLAPADQTNPVDTAVLADCPEFDLEWPVRPQALLNRVVQRGSITRMDRAEQILVPPDGGFAGR